MKAANYFLVVLCLILTVSCGHEDKKARKSQQAEGIKPVTPSIIAIDKGFSQYIAGYTSGVVPVNSIIEIIFTSDFAAKADKQATAGIFSFTPAIKGKTEWLNDNTLVFRPAKLLESGQTYTGELDLSKLAAVDERLRIFPLRLQTLKKDFSITTGTLESSKEAENTYTLRGELAASDFIEASEVETWLSAKLDKSNLPVKWDHSENLIHKFSVEGITRAAKQQELVLEWDGLKHGVNQKGTRSINIPVAGEFIVMDVKTQLGENQKIEIFFSDPPDPSQELEGLVYLMPSGNATTSIENNIVTVIPQASLNQQVTLNVEQAVRNSKGKTLTSGFTVNLNLKSVNPAIQLIGKGVIMPASQNLIFPFTSAGLRAVDLTIIKIFEDNLPWFLQQFNMNGGYNMKRFGRPVYRGKIDLLPSTATGPGTWKLFTIDINDYIDVEPGVLYKVKLGMRRSYATIDCPLTDEDRIYEDMLNSAEEKSYELWDNPDIYYDDVDNETYYSMDFDWRDRDDPCKGAYYRPDRN
ncbi:MAG: hypothetical protein MUE74_13205, partial [Bacteroidales bacterium]|nr:hypothetical protein [Bacteroidales bacterium]